MNQFDLAVVVCEARFPLHDLGSTMETVEYQYLYRNGRGAVYVSDLRCHRCGLRGDALARAWFRQQGRLEDRKRGLNV